eukprot:7470440-Pyramimonas_sp.AAC.1
MECRGGRPVPTVGAQRVRPEGHGDWHEQQRTLRPPGRERSPSRPPQRDAHSRDPHGATRSSSEPRCCVA